MRPKKKFSEADINRAKAVLKEIKQGATHPLKPLWEEIEALLKDGATIREIATRFDEAGIQITARDLAGLKGAMGSPEKRSKSEKKIKKAKADQTTVAANREQQSSAPMTAAAEDQDTAAASSRNPSEEEEPESGSNLAAEDQDAIPAASRTTREEEEPESESNLAAEPYAAGATLEASQHIFDGVLGWDENMAGDGNRLSYEARPEHQPLSASTNGPGQPTHENGRVADPGSRGQQGTSAPITDMYRTIGS